MISITTKTIMFASFVAVALFAITASSMTEEVAACYDDCAGPNDLKFWASSLTPDWWDGTIKISDNKGVVVKLGETKIQIIDVDDDTGLIFPGIRVQSNSITTKYYSFDVVYKYFDLTNKEIFTETRNYNEWIDVGESFVENFKPVSKVKKSETISMKLTLNSVN